MTKGIAITITRMMEVRESRKDDARFHSIWNGRYWVSLGTLVWSPSLARSCGVVAEPVTTRLEFLPPGIIPKDTLVYRRTLMREMQKQGVIR